MDASVKFLLLIILSHIGICHASSCSLGEKRLHPSDEECIPAKLHSYLICLENSGKGVVSVSTKFAKDNSKKYDVKVNVRASGVILSGSGGAGFSKVDTNKLEQEVLANYDPRLVENCGILLKEITQPPIHKITTPLAIPDVRGSTYIHNEPPVYFKTPGINDCTTVVKVTDAIKLGTDADLSQINGTRNSVASFSWKYNGPEPGSFYCVVGGGGDAECERKMAKCQMSPLVEDESKATFSIFSTTKEYRYKETVKELNPLNGKNLTGEKEGADYGGIVEFIDSNTMRLDRSMIFQR